MGGNFPGGVGFDREEFPQGGIFLEPQILFTNINAIKFSLSEDIFAL